jgi:hypothetical protein
MKKKIVEAALLSCIMSLLVACGVKKEEPAAAPVIDKEQIKKKFKPRKMNLLKCITAGNLET